MYQVEYAPGMEAQLAALPPAARRSLEEAVQQLRNDPWQGTPYRPGYPREYRMLAFGEWGIVVCVIGERTATVTLLELAWAG